MSQVRSSLGLEVKARETRAITIWFLFTDCSSLAEPPAHTSSGLRDSWAGVSLQRPAEASKLAPDSGSWHSRQGPLFFTEHAAPFPASLSVQAQLRPIFLRLVECCNPTPRG